MAFKKLKYIIENGFPTNEQKGTIPFTHTSSPTIDDFCTRKRFIETTMFIDELNDPVLDIGSPNVFGKTLEELFINNGTSSLKMDNTIESDFNRIILAPKEAYNTIFCFEIIEHILNPLLFMEAINKLLNKNGIIYLSTPQLPLISIYSTDYHFTEYKASKLEILFEWSGFQIEEKKIFNVHPWWHAFTGFRPLWRRVFQRHMIFKLRK